MINENKTSTPLDFNASLVKFFPGGRTMPVLDEVLKNLESRKDDDLRINFVYSVLSGDILNFFHFDENEDVKIPNPVSGCDTFAYYEIDPSMFSNNSFYIKNAVMQFVKSLNKNKEFLETMFKNGVNRISKFDSNKNTTLIGNIWVLSKKKSSNSDDVLVTYMANPKESDLVKYVKEEEGMEFNVLIIVENIVYNEENYKNFKDLLQNIPEERYNETDKSFKTMNYIFISAQDERTLDEEKEYFGEVIKKSLTDIFKIKF